MSEDLITRAEQALLDVTDGPWHSTGGVVWRVIVIADPNDPTGQSPMSYQEKVCDTSADYAEFIAAARTLVPELVAEVKRLQEQLDGLHEEWGLRYDQLPHDVVFGRAENPDGTVTRVIPMPSEKHARAAQASHAPIGAKNKTVVHRLVSEWEVC